MSVRMNDVSYVELNIDSSKTSNNTLNSYQAFGLLKDQQAAQSVYSTLW